MKIRVWLVFSISIITFLGLSVIPQDAFSLRIADYDQDGISDDLDECPKVSETYNNFEDSDGCPDSVPQTTTEKFEFPDTDGDGIEDRFDSCIDEAENFNGYLDEDGCPEFAGEKAKKIIDSDLDGIPDSNDACPFEQETFNNFEDKDGCPESQEQITISSGDIDCRSGQVLIYRIMHNDHFCTSLDTAILWQELGMAEIVGEPEVEEKIEVIVPEEKPMEEEPEMEPKPFDLKTTIHPEKMRIAAPVPETAKGPQIDFSKGYLVEEIKDGLYWVTEGAYQAMFLTTGQGVIVVDAPPSIGEKYLQAIAEVTDEPITHVIYSHTHKDHVGSISMFPDNAIYIAHQDTAETLAKRNDPNRPVPTVTFEDKYTLEVGNQRLELENYGTIHEPGNLFIYAPNQKVLMLVDVIFPGWVPFKDLAMAQDVHEFLSAHDKVLEYDFDTFIGGHLTRLGTPEDVRIQKAYFQDIQASAAKANQEVSFMDIGMTVGFENLWLVFQIYADTITQQCNDEVVSKWIDKLGGVDLFTYDHCWKISESQRID